MTRKQLEKLWELGYTGTPHPKDILEWLGKQALRFSGGDELSTQAYEHEGGYTCAITVYIFPGSSRMCFNEHCKRKTANGALMGLVNIMRRMGVFA